MRKGIKRIVILLMLPVFLGLIISYLSPIIHPERIWWVALFGLAYPFFVLFCSVLTVFTWVKKWRIKYLFTFIVLIGTPVHVRYFGWGSKASTDHNSSRSFKLMSYNVRLFDFYEWLGQDKTTTRDAILTFISQEQPDVLCIQEYLVDKIKPGFLTQKDIQQTNALNYYFEDVIWEYKNKYYGIATFSRYPIIKSDKIAHEGDNRIFCIYTDIVIQTDTVRVYNLHLESVRLQQQEFSVFTDNDLSPKVRTSRFKKLIHKLNIAYPPRIEQAKKIIEHAQASPYPVIFCGDFNDTPTSYVYNMFNRHYNDAFRKNKRGIGSTYAGKLPVGRIDYIFYTPTLLNSTHFSIQNEKLSDHYAISAEFGVK